MNDELLIKFLLKETSEDENAMVNKWQAENVENALYLTQLEKIWNAAKVANYEVDDEQAWQKFKIKADALPKTVKFIKPKRNYKWLSVAAILIVGIGLWSVYSLLGPAAYTNLASHNEVITEILPDGSELTINKNTELSYAGNFKNHRNIKLEKGDVFFNVAHDKANPFVIEIDKVDVTVVGTSFNIKHLNTETEVIVESGVVKVKFNNEEVRLVKGEKILIDQHTKKLQKEPSTNQLYNYYRTKLFVAYNTPLKELVAILNEAYGSHLSTTAAVENLQFNSTLEWSASLDQNLKIISDALNLKISRNQNEILLSY